MEYNVYVMYPTRELRSDYGTFKKAISRMLRSDRIEENAYLVSAETEALCLLWLFTEFSRGNDVGFRHGQYLQAFCI